MIGLMAYPYEPKPDSGQFLCTDWADQGSRVASPDFNGALKELRACEIGEGGLRVMVSVEAPCPSRCGCSDERSEVGWLTYGRCHEGNWIGARPPEHE